MALASKNVGSGLRPDALRLAWLPVTVRVAWDLLSHGLKVRPELLRDAREHVLRSLPDGIGIDDVEQLASAYTLDYLHRVRERRYRRPAADPDATLPAPRRWRDQLVSASDHIADAVLRLHYGDGLSIERVEHNIAVDAALLVAAQEGLREATREIGRIDELPIGSWTDARLDRLLVRIANAPARGCPGPMGLLSEAGRAHGDICPRCSRAIRLIRHGVLAPSDLFPPDGRPLYAEGQYGLLALLLHPDARRSQSVVADALGDAATPVGPDAWLIDEGDLAVIGPRLIELAELGTPLRHHLRGALVHGPIRWSKGVALGPLPTTAFEAARARPWAEIHGMAPLPPPRPPPPSSARWWIATAALALTVGLVGAAMFVVDPGERPAAPPVELVQTGAQSSLRFDAADGAAVDVLAVVDGRVVRLGDGSVAGKGRWATGDGDYQVHVPSPAFLLLTSPTPLADLDAIIATQLAAGGGLDGIAAAVVAAHPDVVLRRPAAAAATVYSP